MTAAAQEMADLLREVQKLQKELQPVRSAIAALQKREAETPNPTAAGASLHKVATRLGMVKKRYEPFLSRLQELLSEEVPAFLQQTPLLAVGDEVFDGKVTDATRETATATTLSSTTLSPGARRRSTDRSTADDTNVATGQHAEDDAARLIREICPPSTPHLLMPENVRFTQQQLRLRAEMVEYLIATDRIAIADHVTRAYGLPLQWFPRLVALHRERTYGRAVNVGSVNCVYSPTGGGALHSTAPTPAGSPLVTPATRPRAVGANGAGAVMPPKSPIRLPPSAVPLRVFNNNNSCTSTSMLYTRSPAGPSPTAASDFCTALPPPAPLPQRERQSPSVPPRNPSKTSNAAAENGAANTTTTIPEASLATLPAIVSSSASPALMPNLVARVISAAMYLKDDYMDRMVLERKLEQCVGLVSPLLDLSKPSSAENSTPASVEQYKAYVLSRIANLPRQHLHTQSGDPVFDAAMMNVIEELLVYGLQRWAEDDTNMPESAFDARGGETAKTLAAETKKVKAELLKTLTTDTFLSAEEMLLADKVWNEDILFFKRPTRFYCVETGLSTDESADTDSASPRARATGEVISQLVAEAQSSLDTTTGIFIT